MSKILEEETNYQTVIQLVTFNVASEIFAIDISHVQEIIKKTKVTPVPLAPKYVYGLINIRGNIIPVISIREKLGLNPTDDTEDTRVVVLNYNSRKVGFIVDSMNQVIRVTSDKIFPSTSYEEKTYMESICTTTEKFTDNIDEKEEKFITVLKIERLMELD